MHTARNGVVSGNATTQYQQPNLQNFPSRSEDKPKKGVMQEYLEI